MFDYFNFLNSSDLNRYSRHIVLKEFEGQNGQLKLKKCKVCVVGAGGLGNISVSYLASVGFGSITIFDDDIIELNNLNRQIAYNVDDIGKYKAAQLAERIKRLNPDIHINYMNIHLNFDNCIEILKPFDVVLDCTDNPSSRYAINDACARLMIPLVYGSALKWEGQLSVYCYQDGPCLRCIFPQPPNPEIIGKCDDQGIVGPIVGIIGSMQALEAIKICLNLEGVMKGRLLLFDGLKFNTKTVKLRAKKQTCQSCGLKIDISQLSFPVSICEKQYSPVDPKNNLTVKEYVEYIKNNIPHVLLDVRVKSQFNSVRLGHAFHLPLEDLEKMEFNEFNSLLSKSYTSREMNTFCILCRRGRKSRDAVAHLINIFKQNDSLDGKNIYNIEGGFLSWSKLVDPLFPYF